MGNKRPVKIAAIQFGVESDHATQMEKAGSFVRKAVDQGAEFICLPELFHSKYFCQTESEDAFALAHPIPGPIIDEAQSWIAGKNVTLVAPVFEKRAPGVFHNSAAIIHGEKGLLGSYRKMHIPDDPGFYEKYYFSPGDSDPGFKTWDNGNIKFGVAICWDQWFPEAARLEALAGAEILFYPTAIGWHPREQEERGATQHEAWEIVQRSHAVTNGCFVVSVNRVGHELPAEGDGEGIQFWGQSFIAAPDGRIVAKASTNEDEILLAEIDAGEVDQHRIEWPFLRDRRIDAYSGLMKRVLD